MQSFNITLYYVLRYIVLLTQSELIMARAGVTKLDVHKAATRLMENGKNPTVDSVRELLGTGSKSTIAPLLKQWKKEQDSWEEVKDTGLPVSLISTVKALYEGMEQQAAQKIEEAQAVATEALEQGSRSLHEKAQEIKDLRNKLNQTQENLIAVANENEETHKKLDDKTQQYKECSQDNTSLLKQLQLSAKENERLVRLHKQNQANLEHYQNTVEQQRSQERQDTEQRLQQANSSLQRAHKDIQQLNERMTVLTTEAALNKETTEELRNENKSLQETLNTQQLALALNEKNNELLKTQLSKTDIEKDELQVTAEKKHTLFIQSETKNRLFEETIAKLELHLEKLNQINLTLSSEKKLLEQTVSDQSKELLNTKKANECRKKLDYERHAVQFESSEHQEARYKEIDRLERLLEEIESR